jgi:hypothetical protein
VADRSVAAGVTSERTTMLYLLSSPLCVAAGGTSELTAVWLQV